MDTIWLGVFVLSIAVTVWTIIRSTSGPAGAAAPAARDEPSAEPGAPAAIREAATPEAEIPEAEIPEVAGDVPAPPAIRWPPPTPLALPAPADPVTAADAVAAAPPDTVEPRAGATEPARVARARLVVLEDLGLDDVFAVAEERAAPARHAGIKLVTGIAASGLIFAGGVLLLVRGLGALFGKLLRP